MPAASEPTCTEGTPRLSLVSTMRRGTALTFSRSTARCKMVSEASSVSMGVVLPAESAAIDGDGGGTVVGDASSGTVSSGSAAVRNLSASPGSVRSTSSRPTGEATSARTSGASVGGPTTSVSRAGGRRLGVSSISRLMPSRPRRRASSAASSCFSASDRASRLSSRSIWASFSLNARQNVSVSERDERTRPLPAGVVSKVVSSAPASVWSPPAHREQRQDSAPTSSATR